MTLNPRRSPTPLIGYLASGGLSNLANSLSVIAYPWLIYDLTGSAAAMGGIAFVTLAPMVLGAFVGSIVVDRYGVRAVALAADVLSAVSALMIAGLHMTGALSFEIVALLAFVGALLDGPGAIAHDARMPELARLAAMPLTRVNVIDDLIDNGAQLGGPVIAGLAIAIGGTGTALILLAGLSVLAALTTAVTLPHWRMRAFGLSLAETLEGPRFIATNAELRTPLLLAATGMAVFLAVESVLLPAALRLKDRPATDLGIFLGATAIGALAINLTLLRLTAPPSLRLAFAMAFAGLTVSLLLLVLSLSPPVLALAGFLLGVSAGPLTPLVQTLLQTVPPKAIRARVLGSALCLVMMAAPGAALLAGILTDRVGVGATLSAAAAVCAIGTAFAVLRLGAPARSSRDPER